MKETCSNDHNFYSVITNGHHLDTESSNMEILLTIVFGIMTNNTIILIHQNTFILEHEAALNSIHAGIDNVTHGDQFADSVGPPVPTTLTVSSSHR